MKFRVMISFLVVIVIFCLPMLAHAQPDPGGDPDVPIDGGLSLLLAAGVGYAAKKGYDKRKQSKKSESELSEKL